MVACFRPGIDSRGWIREGVGWELGGWWASNQWLERLPAVAAAVAVAADYETIDYRQPAQTFCFEKTVYVE